MSEPYVTTYASEMSGWQDWQPGWRYGVVLIYPPEPVLSQVNALRAVYDPLGQAVCEAHISLTVPMPRPMTPTCWAELVAIAAGIAPLRVRYGPLANYLPYPGVVLAIEPQKELLALVQALESASVFAGAEPRTHSFSAHLTIAEYITVERTLTLMDELAEVAPRGEFLCDTLSLAVPDDAFHFSARRRLPLGGQL